MPGKKRTTKSVSYTEDDDDDFISNVDNNKKLRTTKTNDRQIETDNSIRQPPRKRNEKLSKNEQEELDLALKLSKEIVSTNEISIEIPIISDDKESTTSQSTISSNESQTTIEKESDEQEESLSPKSKRMKRDEEEDELNSEEEEEEEEEPTPRKKPIRKTEEIKKNSEIPTVTTIDLNSTRTITRGQQKPSIPISESTTKKSNVPIGFPTSKIIIPSVQTSRVGLSRKSSAIKPLHPNLNPRIVHE